MGEVQCKHVPSEWVKVLGNVLAYELDASVATRGGQSVTAAVPEPRSERDVGTRRKLRCTQLESGCLSLELFLSFVDAGKKERYILKCQCAYVRAIVRSQVYEKEGGVRVCVCVRACVRACGRVGYNGDIMAPGVSVAKACGIKV